VTPAGSAVRPDGPAMTGPPEHRGLNPDIWPLTTRVMAHGGISVGGVPLTEIAAGHGTPAYVLDEADVRERCRRYRRAFPGAEIAYAGKAFLCRAMARWVDEEGLSLDVCSEGELAVALSAGFPAERIVLHGNAKTPADLRAAMTYGAGRIVLDSAGEIARIAALVQSSSPLSAHPRQRVLVRITPDVDPRVHPAVCTGVEDQKFGFSLRAGAAADAVRRILAQPELSLAGLHCHLGSQITRPEVFETAATRLVALMADIGAEHGVTLAELNLGGGHGVPYTDDDQDFDLAGFASRIRAVVGDACAARRLPVPRLTFEPGRAIVSQSMVTLYHVVSIKHLAGGRTLVAVDGGMSDNPRPALYGARYTVRAAARPTEPGPSATVVGRHCEAGDVLATDVPLPADTRPGDVLAVACTGAYNYSMASGYNMVGRPPVVAVRDGAARLLVRRETASDMRQRDVGM
jgi:diaminopimelate decarboxylase